MVNELKIDISIFGKIDNIAKRNNITDEQWAESSQIRRPSISELRRLLKNKAKASDEKVGRAFTAGKLSLLFSGLLSLIGGEDLKKDLIEIINQEPDQNIRMILWAVLLQNAPQSSRDAAEGSLKLAATTISPKKK